MIDLPRPLAFAFSGGASLGAVQVGMLRAALERGLRPDRIVGTSVGAINGAFIAQGFTAARLDELEQIWLALRTPDVFPGLGMRAVLRLLGSGTHLVANSALRRLLAARLPADHAALEIPMTVVAMELLSGMAAGFSAGALREQVLASAAIPAVFPAVMLDDLEYVDGGVAENVPIMQALRGGARSVLVLDAGYPCALPLAPAGMLPRLLHLLTMALRNQTLGALGLIGRDATVLYTPAPCPLRVAAHDFSNGAALIAGGYQAASEFLDGLALTGPGVYGHPHVHAAMAER